MKPISQKAIERRAKFLKMLELYYLDQRRLCDISRSLGVSESTAHKWFNDWSKGRIFKDIQKPKLETNQILKISKGQYL